MMLIHMSARMLIEPTAYLHLMRFSLRKMRAGYYLPLLAQCSGFAMHSFLFIRRFATSYAIRCGCQRVLHTLNILSHV